MLIVFFKTETLLSENNLFNVNNIKLEKKDKISNNELANQAIKKGFDQLMSRILLKEDSKKLLNLDFSHKFHFAVKANPNLAILNLLKTQGFGAEVVSAGELFKSLKAGIDPSEVIFDGPGKTEFDILPCI